MATVYGETKVGAFRARLDYSTSSTDTTYTISWTAYLNVLSGEKTDRKFTTTVTTTGQSNTSGTLAEATRSSGNYKLCNKSFTVTKTTASQSIKINFPLVGSKSGKTPQTSTASVTITVPARPKRTVTFDVQGHGLAPASQSIFYGYKATQPTDPTASGYRFGGWYTDAECTAPFDFNTAITADITLYAKWIAGVFVKANGSWHTGEIKIKRSGAWSSIVAKKEKINGAWIE